MADNKLFYNVAEKNANAFKDLKQSEKVLGLVHSGEADDFGYIISQGKQFGASKADINAMINVNITVINTQDISTYIVASKLSIG